MSASPRRRVRADFTLAAKGSRRVLKGQIIERRDGGYSLRLGELQHEVPNGNLTPDGYVEFASGEEVFRLYDHSVLLPVGLSVRVEPGVIALEEVRAAGTEASDAEGRVGNLLVAIAESQLLRQSERDELAAMIDGNWQRLGDRRRWRYARGFVADSLLQDGHPSAVIARLLGPVASIKRKLPRERFTLALGVFADVRGRDERPPRRADEID